MLCGESNDQHQRTHHKVFHGEFLRRTNDEVAKALLLDKIAKSGAVKKGEIRLLQSGMIPIDFAVFKYGKAVAALASADFDRTKAAADRFERHELRLMARLLLAQALLRSDDQALKNGEQ